MHADCHNLIRTPQCGQSLELERQAEGIIELESRIEVAEAERDAARGQMQAMTPRPGLPPGMALPSQLGPQGTAKFVTALTKHRWCSPISCSRIAKLAAVEAKHSLPVGSLSTLLSPICMPADEILGVQSSEPIIIHGMVQAVLGCLPPIASSGIDVALRSPLLSPDIRVSSSTLLRHVQDMAPL